MIVRCHGIFQLGDYGYFSDLGHFRRQGNLFTAIKSLIPEADTTPRQQEVTLGGRPIDVIVDNHGLSLPSNRAFNLLLASISSQFADVYLVTRVVQCRECGSCVHALCLLSDSWISGRTEHWHHHVLVHHQKTTSLAPRCD